MCDGLTHKTPYEWRRESRGCQNIIGQTHRWKINNQILFCDMRESKRETEGDRSSEAGKDMVC